MRTAYTFTIVRYVHDAVTGEFANVGVIVYAPDAEFLAATCTSSYVRISRFFGRIEGDYIKDLLRHIEGQTLRLGAQLFSRSIFRKLPEDARACAEMILPVDDSALQLSPVSGGLTTDPRQTLEHIVERYVDRYRLNLKKTSRQDEEILPVFRRPLEERALLPYVQPKLIVAPDYEHEFPLAWKNGVWNACDAVSFDLQDGGAIVEKANKWLGRAINLRESDEPVRLILLVGQPRRSELAGAAIRAENILRKADLEIIREVEADRLAAMVEGDVRH